MYLVKNINASSEVREARIEIDLYTESKAKNKEEAKPISDYFKLNLQKTKEYFERKDVPLKIKVIGKKFLGNARSVKNIVDVFDFFKNL